MLSRNTKFFVISLLLGSATLVQALDLASARANKDVCEGTDGYIHAAKKDPSPELMKFINDINILRKNEYQSIADSTSGKIKDAEDAAAVKLIKDNGGC